MFDRTQKKILIIAGFIFIVFMTILIYIIQNRQSLKQIPFQKPAFAEDAVKGVPDGIDKSFHYSSLKLQEGKSVALCATPATEGTDLKLYLTSHSGNDFWTKVRIFDEKNRLVGESGLIRPGEYIENISLEQAAESGEKLSVKLMLYEKKTYQSAGAATIGVVVL